MPIEGDSISNAREVAHYAEFAFEGAVIANNSVDLAAIGIAVTNFNDGGRLAVVQGNIIRNLLPRRPPGTDPGDAAGVGISVEADSAVSGNVIENAPTAGMMLGWGHYLRDVAVTGNVVRKADIGIAVSVAPGEGAPDRQQRHQRYRTRRDCGHVAGQPGYRRSLPSRGRALRPHHVVR